MTTIKEEILNEEILNEKKLNEKINNYRASLCPFKYLDIKEAIKLADELGISEEDLITLQEETFKECWIEELIEPNDSLYHYMQTEIKKIINERIWKEINLELDYYSNYMQTSWKINNKELDKLEHLIERNLPEFRKMRVECKSLNNLINYYDDLEYLFNDKFL